MTDGIRHEIIICGCCANFVHGYFITNYFNLAFSNSFIASTKATTEALGNAL